MLSLKSLMYPSARIVDLKNLVRNGFTRGKHDVQIKIFDEI